MSDREPEDTEARIVYQRFRRVFGDPSLRTTDARRRQKKSKEPSVPFGSGRDPAGVGDVLDALTAKLGWTSPLAQSDLILAWPDLVGEETAAHSTPTGISEGLLTVQCSSTAWATQLRLMRSAITTQISERYPDAGITSIRFDGPNAPSWKRGPRAIPGRGPRDTYG